MFIIIKFVQNHSMFRSKKKKRLFISCPTWHIEQKIQNNTKDDCYFINTLGGIYIEDELFIDQLVQTIKNEGIQKLSVIANPDCSFIENLLEPQRNLETQAEEVMARIYHKKYDTIQSKEKPQDRRLALAYYCAQFSLGRILQDPQFQLNFQGKALSTGILTNGEAIQI